MDTLRVVMIIVNNRTAKIGHCVICKLAGSIEADEIDPLHIYYRTKRNELILSKTKRNEANEIPSVPLYHSVSCAAKLFDPHWDIPFNARLAISIAMISSDGHVFMVRKDAHMYQLPKAWMFPISYVAAGESFE
jgi:hypothetical protein